MTADESDLLRSLLEQGKPEAYRFIPQIDDVCVKIECNCGCGRLYFEDERNDEVMVLANAKIDREDGGTDLLHVLAFGEKLAALEVIPFDKHGNVEEHPENVLFRLHDHTVT